MNKRSLTRGPAAPFLEWFRTCQKHLVMVLYHMYEWHSLCSYVCLYWPEIFCLQGLFLSACMYVLAFQDQHNLPKWNILSLLVWTREKSIEFKQLDRIFHFGRVCWSWKANTYIRAERKRPWRQNIPGQYRHTYEQRERETDGFHAF